MRRKKTLAEIATDFDWPERKKKSNVRRSRGYGFETWLVKKFIKCGWSARRLGGASTGLPDVVAVNNEKSILYAIEAKSKRAKSVEIPIDEIWRCQHICDMFNVYNTRRVITATRLGENSKPVYSYYVITPTRALIRLRDYIHGMSMNQDHNVEGPPSDFAKIIMPWQKD